MGLPEMPKIAEIQVYLESDIEFWQFRRFWQSEINFALSEQLHIGI
jgi:hypothetical protein